MAIGPILSASSILPRNSAAIVLAALRIQKIIPVTNATAMIDMPPPNASCCSNVMPAALKVMIAPAATDSAVATATPTQTHLSAYRRSVFTKNAIRMLTTSAASRPSRSPIKPLVNNIPSLHKLGRPEFR